MHLIFVSADILKDIFANQPPNRLNKSLHLIFVIYQSLARFLFSQHLMFFQNCNPTGYELNFDIKQFLFVFFLNFFSTPYSLRSWSGWYAREQRGCQQQSRAWPFSFSKKKKQGRTKIEKTAHCLT